MRQLNLRYPNALERRNSLLNAWKALDEHCADYVKETYAYSKKHVDKNLKRVSGAERWRVGKRSRPGIDSHTLFRATPPRRSDPTRQGAASLLLYATRAGRAAHAQPR